MKIVIVGSGGRLGAALMREYGKEFELVGFNHAQLDLADEKQIHAKIDNLDFGVLINAAAFTNVDLCEAKRDEAFAINAEAPRVLAEICAKKNAKLMHFSTDYVFDGAKRNPYAETDKTNPISVYGESKLAGEKFVLNAVGDAVSVPTGKQAASPTIVRVSWVFGPDRPSFVDAIIKRACEEEHVDAIADKIAAPTYTHDIAQMLPRFFDLDASRTGISQSSGILHFANAGECSWQEYAQFALDTCRSLGVPLKAKAVGALKMADMKNFIARRPVYSVLSTAKYFSTTGTTPRNWRDAVAEYIREHVRK
jgi:dTDP-4-dehydrorhamnose reductase